MNNCQFQFHSGGAEAGVEPTVFLKSSQSTPTWCILFSFSFFKTLKLSKGLQRAGRAGGLFDLSQNGFQKNQGKGEGGFEPLPSCLNLKGLTN